MEQDDLNRDEFAIGISVREEGGQLSLILDDLKRIEGASPPRWKQWAYFTYVELDPDLFESSELTEKDLAVIGRAVTMRLKAFRTVRARGFPSGKSTGGPLPVEE